MQNTLADAKHVALKGKQDHYFYVQKKKLSKNFLKFVLSDPREYFEADSRFIGRQLLLELKHLEEKYGDPKNLVVPAESNGDPNVPKIINPPPMCTGRIPYLCREEIANAIEEEPTNERFYASMQVPARINTPVQSDDEEDQIICVLDAFEQERLEMEAEKKVFKMKEPQEPWLNFREKNQPKKRKMKKVDGRKRPHGSAKIARNVADLMLRYPKITFTWGEFVEDNDNLTILKQNDTQVLEELDIIINDGLIIKLDDVEYINCDTLFIKRTKKCPAFEKRLEKYKCKESDFFSALLKAKISDQIVDHEIFHKVNKNMPHFEEIQNMASLLLIQELRKAQLPPEIGEMRLVKMGAHRLISDGMIDALRPMNGVIIFGVIEKIPIGYHKEILARYGMTMEMIGQTVEEYNQPCKPFYSS